MLVLDAYFTIKDIASLLSVSEKTVKNRLKEFGLCVRMTYSNIDDDVLDSWIQRGLGLFPRAGIHCTKYSRKYSLSVLEFNF